MKAAGKKVKIGELEEKRVVKNVVDSFTAFEFIIREKKKGTIYAGDWENKSLLIIPEG